MPSHPLLGLGSIGSYYNCLNSLEPERGLEEEGKDLLWQSANAAVALRLVGVVYEAGSALYSLYRAEEAAVGFASTLEPALGEISASTLSDLEGSFGSGESHVSIFEIQESNLGLKNTQENIGNSTRTLPESLKESLSLEEAKHNEGVEIMKNKIKDLNYPSSDWAKKEYTHKSLDGENISIHYWENRNTGERHGFKFKN